MYMSRGDFINSIEVELFLFGRELPRVNLLKCFNKLCFFDPKGYDVYFPMGKDVHKRYDEESFAETVLKTKGEVIVLRSFKHKYKLRTTLRSDGARIYFNVSSDMWKERKTEIIKNLEEVFFENGLIFGYAINAFDRWGVHTSDLYRRKKFELNDNDYPGILSIPTYIDEKDPFKTEKINTLFLPGHSFTYTDFFWIRTAPYMWFGPDFYKFFSLEDLEEFDNCEFNSEINIGFRKICLWHDISEYNALKYIERQWDFRNVMRFDETYNELRKYFLYRFKTGDFKSNPAIEFKTGKFPHGGELLAIYYLDSNHKTCCKLDATYCDEREMKGNEIVWHERRKLK